MKAVLVTKFGGPEVLDYREVELPHVGSAEVLIRVEAASVNFADIKARYGNYHKGQTPPYIPGLDVAGTVVQVGSEVSTLRTGQRVIAFPKQGSYAEYTVADEILTYPLPDGIDFASAAASPIVSFTSYNILRQVARLATGETVMIHAAAGGVGTTAIQLAKLLGAKTVIGTVGNDAKRDVAVEAGADYVLNYNSQDFAEQVNRITDGRGADVILDSVAGEVFAKSLNCLAMFGRIVNFGNAGGEEGRFGTAGLHASCRSVLGYSLGTNRKHRPETLQDTAAAVLPLLAEGKLQMKIGHRFQLKDAKQAQQVMENRDSAGKILLIPPRIVTGLIKETGIWLRPLWFNA